MSATVHAKLVAAAADYGVGIDSAVRAAVLHYLDDPDAVPAEPAARVVVVNPELAATLARIAAEAEAAELAPDDGRPVDPATVTMPNWPGVEPSVRFSAGVYDRLVAAAAARKVHVSDVVRAAAFHWTRRRQ